MMEDILKLMVCTRCWCKEVPVPVTNWAPGIPATMHRGNGPEDEHVLYVTPHRIDCDRFNQLTRPVI